MIVLKCKRCGKEIETSPRLINRKKYCSKFCQKTIKIQKKCTICNKSFEVGSKREKTAKCCSQKCWFVYNRGENNNNYDKTYTKEERKHDLQSKIEAKGKKRKCSLETRIKIGNANRGEKNGQWKEGKTPLRLTLWRSLFWKEWRLKIFERDKFLCQMPSCDKTTRILNAHHIIQFATIMKNNNIKTREEALGCKELWNTNNGITLCEKCHAKTKMKESHFVTLFQEIVKLNQIL